MRAIKLKFYKRLGMVKYSSRVSIFFCWGHARGAAPLLYQMYCTGCCVPYTPPGGKNSYL